ncbi:unnamed protein product, partial [Durusdinium trenchii]
VLGEERSVGWINEERQAWVSPTVWHKEKGYGEGRFEFQCGAERRCWRYLDYKDRSHQIVVPNEKEEPVKVAVAAQLTLNGQSDREWPCEGWREFLANEDPAALVPGKRPRCPRCQDNHPKQGKAPFQVPWSFNEHPVDTQELILMGTHSPLKHRPAFAYGIRAQEVFVGSGSWTKAMEEAGLASNEPIELFSDPLQKRGRRDHFDLKDEKGASFYLQDLAGNNGASRSMRRECLGIRRAVHQLLRLQHPHRRDSQLQLASE